MGATQTIAKWIVETNYEDIPPDAIRVANESCFDLLGVILAGSTQPVGEIIQKYTNSQGAAPESTILAGGFQSTQANAALATAIAYCSRSSCKLRRSFRTDTLIRSSCSIRFRMAAW